MYARDIALIATPIGMVRISGTDRWIEAVSIEGGARTPVAGMEDAVRNAAWQIGSWFAGEIKDFDVPLAPAMTPRGDALRNAMRAIGYGETMSYGELARAIGSGARAIGQACARNSFPIIVPCHRVLNTSGALGAYSAGDGPATKAWLLEHERRHAGLSLL